MSLDTEESRWTGGSYHHQSSNKQKEEQKTDILFIFDVIAGAVRSIIINTSLKYRRDNRTWLFQSNNNSIITLTTTTATTKRKTSSFVVSVVEKIHSTAEENPVVRAVPFCSSEAITKANYLLLDRTKCFPLPPVPVLWSRWSSPLSFSLMFRFCSEDFFFFYHFIYFVLILMLSWKTDLYLDIKKLGRFLHELYFRSSDVVSQMQFAERLVLFRKRCGSGPGK